MRVIPLGAGREIETHGSEGATVQPLARPIRQAQLVTIWLEPGGLLGRHPATVDQLFVVMSGSGSVSGADGATVSHHRRDGSVLECRRRARDPRGRRRAHGGRARRRLRGAARPVTTPAPPGGSPQRDPYTLGMGTHNRTELARIDPGNPDPGLVGRAADYLRRGFLVAFPTETVYGLGGNALSDAAVERILVAKGRDRSDPLIVHIAAIEDLTRVATGVPAAAEALVEAFWPGPLTLVLRRAEGVATAVSGGRTTVAVRLPSHPVARALIRTAGIPVAAPSANRFMHTSATTAQHVMDDLDGRVELVLDGGPATVGIESTVVDASTPELRLLRPGAVSLEELQRVAGSVIHVGGASSAGSPGMLARHYAPGTRLRLVQGDEEALVAAVDEEQAAGHRVAVICTDFEAALFHPQVLTESLGSSMETMAKDLYAAMRRLDDGRVDVMVVRDYGDVGLARAIGDRLRRAATPHD